MPGMMPGFGGGIIPGMGAFPVPIGKTGAGGLAGAGPTNWGAVAGGGLMTIGGAMSWMGAGESKLGNLLGGAQTGAGLGTMIMPGIGTAVGAGIGAVVGLIS